MTEQMQLAKGRIHAMRWSGDRNVTRHSHDFVEIVFLAKCFCQHVWQGSEVRLIPGDCFIIAPFEEHAFIIEDATVIFNCLFYPDALGNDWENLQQDCCIQDLLVIEPFYRTETGKQAILHLNQHRASQVEALYSEMIDEVEFQLPLGQQKLKSLLILLLVSLSRHWSDQYAGQAGLYDERRNLLAETLAYIDCHVADAISLEKLASRCYVTPGHFRRLFREGTGLTPLEYINKLRIGLAQQLLLNPDLGIAEIGAQVGLPEANYFARLFKSLVGCSPSAYRKKQLHRP
jgi:AraC-like DNA-binding protein